MRSILSFICNGDTLAATLDDAGGTTGLLIVSGGNEIRIGAHRGMARLAADIAASGYPALRFDRRGIGDSEGENRGFESSGDDLNAAITAFRTACPSVNRIIAFGNCDAASALALHRPAIDAMVISNPWVIEPQDELPPTASIRAHYLRRLRDPKAWISLLRGAIDIRKLAVGLGRIAQTEGPSDLAARVAAGLAAFNLPIKILLAKHDGTAVAFADQWSGPAFATVRTRANISVQQLDSASHSFASDDDYAALKAAILNQCAAKSA